VPIGFAADLALVGLPGTVLESIEKWGVFWRGKLAAVRQKTNFTGQHSGGCQYFYPKKRKAPQKDALLTIKIWKRPIFHLR
jgi:hypothetical protein